MKAVMPAGLVLLPLLACADPGPELGPPSCELRVESVVELGPGAVCGLTTTGLLLRRDDARGAVLLERITAAGAVEELRDLTPLTSECGALVEDPSDGAIWLALAGELYRLDADLTLTPIADLSGDAGQEVVIADLARIEGGLVLAGWVVQALDAGGSVGEALVERRNADGSLVWRQIGYAGHNPIAVLSELPYTSITQLEVQADGGLVAIAAIEGWQSIINTVLGIDPEDGSIAWVDAWTGQVIPKLGYDAFTDNLMISEPRSRIVAFDPEVSPEVSVDDAETLVPGQTVLTKLRGAERIWWRAELEWPGWVALDVTRPVAVPTDSYPAAYTGVSGRDREQAAQRDRFALTRHDWTGALDCVQPLPEVTHGGVQHLRALAADRLVLTTSTRSPIHEPEVAAALILLRDPTNPGQSP